MDLVVTVERIEGHCPVYNLGDSFLLKDGFRLASDKPLCMHALASLMPFYNALRFAQPEHLGLADKEHPGKAVIQCPDPCALTGGGTVTFSISRTTEKT